MTKAMLGLAGLSLAAAAALAADAAAPARPQLAWPVACEPGRSCEIQHYVDRDPGPGVRDYRCGLQTYDKHNGVDIRLPDMAAQKRGVAVLAAAPGRVARLRDGEPDISVRAPNAPSVAGRECGNGVVIDHGGGWESQYCHMARGSIGVKPGQAVAAGTPLGRIGLSGDTEFPHLHFTVRHAGVIVDPFAPDMKAKGCAPQPGLWRPAAAARAAYHAGTVLNAGFATSPLTMAQVEQGAPAAPTRTAGALVAYVRAIALLPGDSVELTLRGPDGAVLAHSRRPPLERWRAQDLTYVGKRRPASGWPAGAYVADYKVWRDGKVALSRRITIRL
jgi:hypothetical protein